MAFLDSSTKYYCFIFLDDMLLDLLEMFLFLIRLGSKIGYEFDFFFKASFDLVELNDAPPERLRLPLLSLLS